MDLAGLMLLVVAAAVLSILALLGYPFGRVALPFAVGTVVGDALMYAAIRLERFRTLILVFAVLLLAAGFALVVDFGAGYSGSSAFNPQLPWDVSVVLSKFAIGLLVGFGGIVLSGFFWPTVFSADTWDDAVVQRRASVRDVLVLGGMLLGVILLVLILLGFYALVVWVAVNFG